MKNLLLASLVLSSLTFGTAFAGNEKGNGGGVHLCNNGQIEMYDLYEGFTRYNFTPDRDNSLSVEGYLNKAIKKVNRIHPGIGARVKKEVDYLLKEQHLLVRSNLALDLIEDANILVVDIGCSYKQLANWDDKSGNVLVNASYYNRLDTINKAALYLHEALYKLARDYFYASDSDDIRPVVANILSHETEVEEIEKWAEKLEQIKINKYDESFKVNITSEEGDTVIMDLQLGDINFYDPNTKIELITIKDFSAAKTRMNELEPEIAGLKSKIKELKVTVESIHSIFEKTQKKKREVYYNQIETLQNKLYLLEEEYKLLKDVFNQGVVTDVIVVANPGFVGGATSDWNDVKSKGKEIIFTVIVKVNGKIVYENKSKVKSSDNYFGDSVQIKSISQNKLK